MLVLFENRSLSTICLVGSTMASLVRQVLRRRGWKGFVKPNPWWAEHQPEEQRISYKIATDMDSPSPDSRRGIPIRTTDCSMLGRC